MNSPGVAHVRRCETNRVVYDALALAFGMLNQDQRDRFEAVWTLRDPSFHFPRSEEIEEDE